MTASRMTKLIVTASVAVAVTTSVVAWRSAPGSDDHRSPAIARPTARANEATQPVLVRRTPAELKSLRVFRRDAIGADRVANDALTYFGPQSDAAGEHGINAGLARRAPLGSFAAWLIPARERRTCLIVNTAAGSARATERLLPSYTTSCSDDRDLVAGRLLMTMAPSGSSGAARGAESRQVIAGVVPDGVRAVRLELSDGRQRDVVPRGNVYAATLRDVSLRSASFAAGAGSRGRVTVRPAYAPPEQ